MNFQPHHSKDLIPSSKELKDSVCISGQDNEDMFHWLAEMSPYGIFVCDKDGIIQDINAAGLRILGANAQSDIIGKRHADFVHPSDQPSFMDHLNRPSQHGEPASLFETNFLRHGGGTMAVEVSASSLYLNGRLCTHVQFRDITQVKKDQEILRCQTEEIRWLMKHMANAFVIWGTVFDHENRLIDIRFEYFNDAYEKVSGLKLAEVQGKTVREVWPATEQSWFDVYGEVATTGSIKSFEMYHAPTQGFYACTAYRPFENRDRICCVFENITQQRKSEERLKYRENLENLIAKISSHFVNKNPEEFDAVIQDSLQKIAEFTGTDRCFLLFLTEDKSCGSISHEWCAANVPSDIKLLQNLPLSDFRFLSEPILQSRIVQVQRVADLPRHVVAESLASAFFSSKSFLAVPIEFGRSVVGCLGLDAVFEEKSWPADIEGPLRVIGEVIASALERKRIAAERNASAHFLQQVIHNAPFGAHFYHLHEDGRLIFTQANKSADILLKTDHNSLLGKSIEEAFPALRDTPIPSLYKEIASGGSTYHQEHIDYDANQIKGAFDIDAFQTIPGHMAVFFTDITERKRMDAALNEEVTRRRLLFEQSPFGIAIVEPETMRIIDFNEAAHQQLGYSREEFAQLSVFDLDPSESPEQTRIHTDSIARDGRLVFETVHKTKQGDLRNVQVTINSSNVLGRQYHQSIWRDITEQKQAEEERRKLQSQLMQAQKMESVGRLAGGVAHDFNNMLGVIIGHADLALDHISRDNPLYGFLEEIRHAAQHSADLTHQLLAFARKQTISPVVLNLNESIDSMLKMLRRLLGEDITLVWDPDNRIPMVKIDPSQLDQILTNLCVNARDAIAGPGQITIRTTSSVVTPTDCAGWLENATPGEYVVISIRDTGCGMSPYVLQHLFEPFFTTKEIGQGTGLGLATVYGIIRQHDGFIHAVSEQEKGTEFIIYLPAAQTTIPNAVKSPVASKPCEGGGKAILLVEDEPSIRKMAKLMLQKMNFHVLAAASPQEAIQQVQDYDGEISLLISDIIMPEMNGRDLAERIKAMKPGLHCLYMSGYSADIIANHGVLDEGLYFIQKPFSFNELCEKINAILEPAESP